MSTEERIRHMGIPAGLPLEEELKLVREAEARLLEKIEEEHQRQKARRLAQVAQLQQLSKKKE